MKKPKTATKPKSTYFHMPPMPPDLPRVKLSHPEIIKLFWEYNLKILLLKGEGHPGIEMIMHSHIVFREISFNLYKIEKDSFVARKGDTINEFTRDSIILESIVPSYKQLFLDIENALDKGISGYDLQMGLLVNGISPNFIEWVGKWLEHRKY